MGRVSARKQQAERMQLAGAPYYFRWIERPTRTYSPVLFLGGAFQTMESWNRTAEFFGQFTSTLVVDPPGMGVSPSIPESTGVDFLVEAVRAVLDKVNVSRVCIAAASYGAAIAYQFAQQYPERVERLAMSGVMDRVPPRLQQRAASHLVKLLSGQMEAFADEVIEGLMCLDATIPIQRREIIRRLMRRQLLVLSPERMRQFVTNTRRLLVQPPLDLASPPPTPALLFTGEHDPFTRPDHVRTVAAAIDRAVFTTIQEADHLCHLERFETVVELVSRFFADRRLEQVDGCNLIEHYARGQFEGEARNCQSH